MATVTNESPTDHIFRVKQGFPCLQERRRVIASKTRRGAKAARVTPPESSVSSKYLAVGPGLALAYLRYQAVFAQLRVFMPDAWQTTAAADADRKPGDEHGVYAGPDRVLIVVSNWTADRPTFRNPPKVGDFRPPKPSGLLVANVH